MSMPNGSQMVHGSPLWPTETDRQTDICRIARNPPRMLAVLLMRAKMHR